MTGFEMILPVLRPIQAHILDPDVSEIMVNGPEQVFVERGGYLEQIEGVTLNEKSLMVAVKNIAGVWATTSRRRSRSSIRDCQMAAVWPRSFHPAV